MSTVTSSSNDATDRRSVEQRRTELIDAAVAVLSEDGLDRATTRAITDRAGLALGAFHYAFDSKRELLAAVTEQIAQSLVAGLQASLDEVGDDLPPAVGEPARVADHLRRLLDRFWERLEQTPELQLAQYELTVHALRQPGMQTVAASHYDRCVDAVADAIARVRGGPRDEAVGELARFVVATLDGLLLHRLVEGDGAAARRRLERYLDSLETIVAVHLEPTG